MEDDYSRLFRLFMRLKKLLRPPVSSWFGYTYDIISAEDEPYLILANHNTDLDPVFLGLAVERHCYFVATENILRKESVARFMKRVFDPIIHYKGKTGTVSVKNILKTLRSGRSVAMFAEGNRSFNGLTCPIAPATIKLARKCGTNVVTYRFEGGYLTQPRWSSSFRRGKITGKLIHVYTPAELKAMSDSEAYEKLCADLFEDCYATQERDHVRYRGRALAEHLETALFMCPECGSFSSLHSKGNALSCSECGAVWVFDEEGYLNRGDEKHTVTEYDSRQLEGLKKAMDDPDPAKVLFTDETELWEIGEDHRAASKTKGKLTAFTGGFMFNDIFMTPSGIEGAALFSSNTIDLTISGRQYEIHGRKDFCALKYKYLYDLMTNGQKE